MYKICVSLPLLTEILWGLLMAKQMVPLTAIGLELLSAVSEYMKEIKEIV